MPNTYLATRPANNKPLRASEVRAIYDQALHLYIPAQAVSPFQVSLDPANPYKTLIDSGSTTYVDIPGLSVTIASSGRRLFVHCPLHVGIAAGDTFEIVTVIDSVVQTNSNRHLVVTAAHIQGAYLHTYHFMSSVIAAGQHTVKLQMRRTAGAGTMAVLVLQNYRMIVREY